MAKFKKGDRVRLVRSDYVPDVPEPPVGAIGTILQDDDSLPWTSFPGHVGRSMPMLNNPLADAFVVSDDQLELIP